MASLQTLSSTISRLNLLQRSSFNYSLTSLKLLKFYEQRIIRPARSPLSFSTLSNRSSTFKPIKMSSKDDLIVLGIETSCDDTAAAVVRGSGEILSQVVSSQADLLVQYGGVAPKMAEEAHSQAIDPVVQEALDKANLTERDLSAVAVTIGPGLSLCLRVGVQKARNIASRFNLPVVGVHHMEAHALVARLIERELQFPFLALLISGGHNLLVLAHNLGQYTQLGTTIDDAIGEAFDKTAKWLGLDLRRSGGPAVEKLALEGDSQAVKFSRVAVLHLEERCQRAIEWALKIEPSIKHLVVSGGVASNKYVRARLDQVVRKNSLQLVCPPPSLCTDNGVMVAWTGIEHFCVGRYDPPPSVIEPEDFVYDLRPRWPLGEEYAEGRSEARSLRTARIHPSLTSLIQASMQQQS
ncbi:probable tRNA N6-adenosine threonylcarbamoyltransferase, mitochondrial isoform X2 [Pistacia vera]|uniref:probable tRNA N6-adenosine threonylcarbamoyltransferase, mitochondrial isoform X2 n=1 Tax=Pistacia vera TaxID=55513 RepID=UPI001263AEF9|nr:probable tRNA N6-adenosine threonylcarbamoyltransferase, mitochondrial isoform X2 [Pistacia vera]